MGLTSSGTVVVAVLLLLVLTVGTLVLWRPLEATGPGRWPLRAGMVFLSQVAAVLVAALLLNDSYSFYVSWAELFGQHARSSVGYQPVGLLDSQLTPQLRSNYLQGVGTVVEVAVPGTRSKVPTRGELVYLPPAYGDPAQTNRTFPVVELLAGFIGSPASWTTGLGITSILDEEIASGRSAPFIAVIPTEYPIGSHDTECVNAVGGFQMSTYLSYDVRSATERAFRASHSGRDWTAMGYSTGGYCATNLAFQHPDMFSAAVSIAGYNRADHNHFTGNLFGSNKRAQQLNDVVWRAHNLPIPALNLLLVASKQDPSSVFENTHLAAAARPPLSVYLLTVKRGGHNPTTWRAELPACLAWLSRFVSGPLAPAPTVDGAGPVLTGPQAVVQPHPGPGTTKVRIAAGQRPPATSSPSVAPPRPTNSASATP